MSIVIRNNAQFVRRGSVGRITVQMVDCDGNPVDAAALKLNVLRGDCAVYSEDYNQILVPQSLHRSPR